MYHSSKDSKEKFSKGNDIFPKERHVSPRKNDMNDPSRIKRPPRFVIPPSVSLGQEWHVVKHKKIPQKFTITQKIRMHRQRAMEKRELPEEMLQGKVKEAENLKEEVMQTPKKTKFGRKALEDDESSCGSTKKMVEEMDLGTILIGTIPISLNCSTISLTFAGILQVKGNGGKPCRSEKNRNIM